MICRTLMRKFYPRTCCAYSVNFSVLNNHKTFSVPIQIILSRLLSFFELFLWVVFLTVL